jgi:hypothetical protein
MLAFDASGSRATGIDECRDRNGEACQSLSVQFVTRALPFRRKAHKASVDENLQMLRNGRLGEIEMADHILAAAAAAIGQVLKDFDARRVGERGELRRQAQRMRTSGCASNVMGVVLHRSSSINDECNKCNELGAYSGALGAAGAVWPLTAVISAASPSGVFPGTLKT